MDIVTIDGIPVFEALVGDDETGMLRISLVEDPAVQSNFVALSQAQRKPQLYAIQDEEKRLVLGVVMRADFPIYRYSRKEGEYYIIYRAATIRTMAEKYLLEGRQNNVNLAHEDGSDVDGVQMVQYFIKGNGLNPEGFDDIADGSLFAEFHVVNDEVWDAIKEGTYKGFSLEGIFDLVPERNKDDIQVIVDTLDGLFARIIPNYKDMTKVKGLLARLAKAIVEMGNVTTDKGVLQWDGEEDLKAGDAVYIENTDGEREDAPDGEYITGDGKTIVVAGGKVSEIRDPEAEVGSDPAAGEESFGTKATDKGEIEWDGEEDLKEGDNVYVRDENGERTAAPDGEYTTEDGKVIVVVEGKVAEIRDPEAEVEPQEEMTLMQRIAQHFSESYDEKRKKILDAIISMGFDPYGWLMDCGDDFAVFESWDADYNAHYTRFDVSWDADGNAIVSNPLEVKPAFIPKDEEVAFASQVNALQQENETLRSQVEEFSKVPAAQPAHEEVKAGAASQKTGDKGKDRLGYLMSL